MKATGIVRRIDDLGRVVIPKEIRRTMRIREGDPSQMTLAPWERFCFGMLDLARRRGWNGLYPQSLLNEKATVESRCYAIPFKRE